MTCDLTIAGAGPVGCALALCMKKVVKDIRLIDAASITNLRQERRKLAISYGSKVILNRLGIWQNLRDVTAINQIHVSHQGHFGRALLKKESLDLPALGYVVSYNELHYQLLCGAKNAGVEIMENSSVTCLTNQNKIVQVEVKKNKAKFRLDTRLAVIADGGSSLAKTTIPNYIEKKYDQTALLALVTTDKAHNNLAYERFTENGPIALLPFGHSYALVWADKPDQSDERCAIDDQSFLTLLQEHFGHRAGQFTSVSDRKSVPIKMQFTPSITKNRILVLGNAAQALHPVAAQGLNLGFRDVFELFTLASKKGKKTDLGSASLLSDYRRARSTDRIIGIGFTELLNKLYSNDNKSLAMLRGMALMGLDLLPFLKNFTMRRLIFGSKLS